MAIVACAAAVASAANKRAPQLVATNCQDFILNIQRSEGGAADYRADNGRGYYGMYQFGQAALTDLGYMKNGGWTGKNGISSLEDWFSNPAVQDAAFLEYGNLNLRYLGNWQQYIGQTIGGVTVTRAGLIAGSHLVGADGLQTWLTNGGVCNDATEDANGTCARTYVAENQTNDDCTGATTEAGGGVCLSAQPVNSPVIYSEYGAYNRAGVSGGNNGWHRGVDMWPQGAQGSASNGQPLYAAHDGKASFGSMGPQVRSSQFWTKYLHSPSKPTVGKQFNAGEEIGKIGTVQSAGKPHLHFEVLVPPNGISATRCVAGAAVNNDCVFPSGSNKRSASAYAPASAIQSAAPKTWYYVNPEYCLASQVPVQGNAAARTGRSQSLPNSCTPGNNASDSPTSAGEYDTATAMTGSEGEYYTSGTMANAIAGNDRRSLLIDMGRASALEIRAFSEDINKLGARMDNTMAHLLLITSSIHQR